ncbi:MAG: DUF302 domain-containing protein [Sphingobacteriia bacterium]|nr:DUF302 domain-containing protein [Sphingobacteriia bacterium]
MSYYLSKKFKDDFDPVIEKVIQSLKKQGFGILTDIDMKETLKSKLNVDFYNYRILGACNPPFAYKALQAEDKIGTMLPCNVIIQERQPGEIEVSVIDPVSSMQAVQNQSLTDIAVQVRQKLEQVIAGL